MIITNNGQSRSMIDYNKYVKKVNELYNSLTHEEKKIVDIVLSDIIFPKNDSVDKISEIMGVLYAMEFRQVPVSPEVFYNSEYFLGESVKDIYPEVRKDLISFAKGDYVEAIVTGGIGWGKSYWTAYATVRIIYELSCFKNPASALGVAAGTKLTIAMLSVNEKQAREVMFSEIGTKVASSPYFNDVFKYRITKKEMTFGNAKKGEPVIYVVPRANTDNSVIGLTVIAAIVDEINFIHTTKKAQQNAMQRGIKSLTKQEQLYGILKKRIASRFMSGGKQLGKIFLSSSKLSKSDFTTKRISSSKYDESIFVRDYANWQVKEQGKHLSDSFFVLVGNNGFKSKILKSKDIEALNVNSLIENNVDIIQAPKDLYSHFETDIESAIADLAGRVSTASMRYFKNAEIIDRSLTKRLPVPYRKIDKITYKKDNIISKININEGKHTTDSSVKSYLYEESYVSNSKKNPPDFSNLCDKQKDGNGGFIWRPKVNPEATRFIHIDGSISQDSTGIAMGHMVKTIFRRIPDTDQYEELPVIIIDVALQIEPPISEGGEIEYSEIRDMVYALSKIYNFQIKLVTMDGVERVTNLQHFRNMGFETQYVSVDRSNIPYNILKETMRDNRIVCHLSNILKHELSELLEDPTSGKIDHPAGGSKDVADAVCGVCYAIHTNLILDNTKEYNHKKSFINRNNVSMVDLYTSVYSNLNNEQYFSGDMDAIDTQIDLEKLYEGDEEALELISKMNIKEKNTLTEKINGNYFPQYDEEIELDVTITPFEIN